jgi:hypothetical protein
LIKLAGGARRGWVGRRGPRLQPVSREQHTGGNPRRPRVRGVADRVSALSVTTPRPRHGRVNVISSVTLTPSKRCGIISPDLRSPEYQTLIDLEL